MPPFRLGTPGTSARRAEGATPLLLGSLMSASCVCVCVCVCVYARARLAGRRQASLRRPRTLPPPPFVPSFFL